jgi:hypothetical protein
MIDSPRKKPGSRAKPFLFREEGMPERMWALVYRLFFKCTANPKETNEVICEASEEDMKLRIFALFLLGSVMTGIVLAQAVPSTGAIHAPRPDPRIFELELAVNRLTQEQQSVYQQFQMVQEMRRNELQAITPIIYGPPAMGGVKEGPPPSYDDTVRIQRERRERIEQYSRDLNQLYARYTELGNQKKALLDQIMELKRESARAGQ